MKVQLNDSEVRFVRNVLLWFLDRTNESIEDTDPKVDLGGYNLYVHDHKVTCDLLDKMNRS